MTKRSDTFWWSCLAICIALLIFVDYISKKPASHDRDWKPEYARIPYVTFNADQEEATIRNVRNFTYNADMTVKQARYDTRSYDLNKVKALWYGVQPFYSLMGHSFVSFEFEEGDFLVLSIEARQEVGEDYGLLAGILNEFELTYIWSDERDVLGRRSHVQRVPVHLYEINVPEADIRAYLESLLKRTQKLEREPEFYKTITQNCTTSLFEMTGVPELQRYADYRVLFPAYAYRLLHELELIDTSADADVIHARRLMDPQIGDVAQSNFSDIIRGRE